MQCEQKKFIIKIKSIKFFRQIQNVILRIVLMGCANSKGQALTSAKVQSVSNRHKGMGLLRLRIGQLPGLKNYGSILKDSLSYVKLSFANQQFMTDLYFSQNDKIKPCQQEFCFAINQEQKKRSLSIQLFNKISSKSFRMLATAQQLLSQSLFNSIDENLPQQQDLNFKLVSNRDQTAGWFRVFLQFLPSNYTILKAKINSVTMRNSPVSQRKVYVKIQIGGQIFQTESSTESSKYIPAWPNCFHSFIIPQHLYYGELFVYEKNQNDGCQYLLGQLKFDVRTIQLGQKMQQYCEDVTLKENVTGTVKLQLLKTQQNNQELMRVDPPRKIRYLEHLKRENERQKQYRYNSFNGTPKKNYSLPKTNYSDHSNTNSPSSFQFKPEKQKPQQHYSNSMPKNNNMPQKNKRQNSPILHFKPLHKPSQHSMIDLLINKKIGNEQYSNESQRGLIIQKTSSILINSQQKVVECGLKKYPNLIEIKVAERRTKFKQINFDQVRFLEIQIDLKSRSSNFYSDKSSKILKENQAQQLESQISLKEQSTHDFKEKMRKADMIKINQVECSKDYISQSNIQKRDLIKNIGQLFDSC